MQDVKVIPAREVPVARQAAREEYEAVYLARVGKGLPRADGDWWWPGTEPRLIVAESAPAPTSRVVDVAHRDLRRQ